MVNKYLLAIAIFLMTLWAITSHRPAAAMEGNCPVSSFVNTSEIVYPAPSGFSPGALRLCEDDRRRWERQINSSVLPCNDGMVYFHPFLVVGDANRLFFVPPITMTFPENRAKLHFFGSSQSSAFGNVTPATRMVVKVTSWSYGATAIDDIILDSVNFTSRASQYYIFWEFEIDSIIAVQGGSFSVEIMEPGYWSGGESSISSFAVAARSSALPGYCSIPFEVYSTPTPAPNVTTTATPDFTITPDPSFPTNTPTPLPSGPTLTPIPATSTATPTRTPNPNHTPQFTTTPWPTSEGGTPTVFPQATNYAAVTVTPGGSGGSGGIVTPPPVATFASLTLPPWSWPSIPEASPFPTSTAWPGSGGSGGGGTGGTPTPGPGTPVTTTPGISVTVAITTAPAGPAATAMPAIVAEGYLIATRWAEPVDAAFGQLLATDTVTGPATFSIVGVGQQVEYMVDTVVEPFQLARALVYYMPNTWPLAGAFMTVIFVVTANMVWRFSLNVIVTSFELFRRLWGMLPFT